MKTLVGVVLALTLVADSGVAQQGAERDALIARAKALELNTPYTPPPGDALEHHTSGFAKIMCSAVFITGLDPDFAAENVGYFTSPYAERAKVGRPDIDRANQVVHVALPGGATRTAVYLGSQGCVTLPMGHKWVRFTPKTVKSNLPDAGTQPWPMGDRLPNDPPPSGIDAAKVKRAVDAAFDPAAGLTAAIVVTWRGRLIAERYGERIRAHTPLESWSMGKSLTATLMGILIKQGVYDLWQPAPIPEWQSAGDPRRSGLPTFCACPAGCASGRRRIPATILRGRTPITFTFTPAVRTPLNMRLRARSNGRPAMLGDIATPIRC